jgi:hypothetical protein
MTLSEAILLRIPVTGLAAVAAFVYWQNERDAERDQRK